MKIFDGHIQSPLNGRATGASLPDCTLAFNALPDQSVFRSDDLGASRSNEAPALRSRRENTEGIELSQSETFDALYRNNPIFRPLLRGFVRRAESPVPPECLEVLHLLCSHPSSHANANTIDVQRVLVSVTQLAEKNCRSHFWAGLAGIVRKISTPENPEFSTAAIAPLIQLLLKCTSAPERYRGSAMRVLSLLNEDPEPRLAIARLPFFLPLLKWSGLSHSTRFGKVLELIVEPPPRDRALFGARALSDAIEIAFPLEGPKVASAIGSWPSTTNRINPAPYRILARSISDILGPSYAPPAAGSPKERPDVSRTLDAAILECINRAIPSTFGVRRPTDEGLDRQIVNGRPHTHTPTSQTLRGIALLARYCKDNNTLSTRNKIEALRELSRGSHPDTLLAKIAIARASALTIGEVPPAALQLSREGQRTFSLIVQTTEQTSRERLNAIGNALVALEGQSQVVTQGAFRSLLIALSSECATWTECPITIGNTFSELLRSNPHRFTTVARRFVQLSSLAHACGQPLSGNVATLYALAKTEIPIPSLTPLIAPPLTAGLALDKVTPFGSTKTRGGDKHSGVVCERLARTLLTLEAEGLPVWENADCLAELCLVPSANERLFEKLKQLAIARIRAGMTLALDDTLPLRLVSDLLPIRTASQLLEFEDRVAALHLLPKPGFLDGNQWSPLLAELRTTTLPSAGIAAQIASGEADQAIEVTLAGAQTISELTTRLPQTRQAILNFLTQPAVDRMINADLPETIQRLHAMVVGHHNVDDFWPHPVIGAKENLAANLAPELAEGSASAPSMSRASTRVPESVFDDVVKLLRRTRDGEAGFRASRVEALRLPGGKPSLLTRCGREIGESLIQIKAASRDDIPGPGVVYDGLQLRRILSTSQTTPNDPYSAYKKAWPWLAPDLLDTEQSAYFHCRLFCAVLPPPTDRYTILGVHYSLLMFNEHFRNGASLGSYLVPTKALRAMWLRTEADAGFEDAIRCIEPWRDAWEVLRYLRSTAHPVLDISSPSILGGLHKSFPALSTPHFEWERQFSSGRDLRDSSGHINLSSIRTSERFRSREIMTSVQMIPALHNGVRDVSTRLLNLYDALRIFRSIWHKGQTPPQLAAPGLPPSFIRPLRAGERMFLDVCYDWHREFRSGRRPLSDIPLLTIAPTLTHGHQPDFTTVLDPATMRMRKGKEIISFPVGASGEGAFEQQLWLRHVQAQVARTNEYDYRFYDREALPEEGALLGS